MADLDREISAFEKIRGELEKEHMGEWVIVHGEALVGIYESFELAAQVAVSRFGRGPYLIRQVGAPPVTLPASVMYYPAHAGSKVRV